MKIGVKQSKYKFFGDRFVLFAIALSAVINAGIWWYLSAKFDSKDSFITIHFTVASGVDLVGKASDIYNLPYWAFILSAINILAARLAYRYDVFSSYVLVGVLPVINFLTFLNGIILVTINMN